ncbi:trypco2 family protein [Pseudorhodobacter ferrugineus]|uniref:trypco2 family protein n=1 Tax=Pseudorhodobacter ferrugineus TaxID=77008 RepID=UPI00067B84D3|nr:trypco2 family protein [Pseudorhodobacter ferrugineus]
MDLKDFIVETVSSIVEASADLTIKFESHGVVVNPPANSYGRGNESFAEDSVNFANRRVQNIEFDVAVTASSSTSGSGGGGFKIWVAEGSAEGSHVRSNEQVNRIKFSVPLSLSASRQEKDNVQKKLNTPTTRHVDGMY